MALPSPLKIKGDDVKTPRVRKTPCQWPCTLGVFRFHLSVLVPCQWWGRIFLNHSNTEAVLNKRQPGDSHRKTKQSSNGSFILALKNIHSRNKHPLECLFRLFQLIWVGQLHRMWHDLDNWTQLVDSVRRGILWRWWAFISINIWVAGVLLTLH